MRTAPLMLMLSVAALTCALKTDSHPKAVVAQAQPSAIEPCVSHLESPNYPPLARQTRIAGKATVSVLVYRDGTTSVSKEGTGHPLLRGAAQENLKTWKFRPNDSQEPIHLDVEYEFILDQEHPTDGSNFASTATLDLPRRVWVYASAQKEQTIEASPVKKKH